MNKQYTLGRGKVFFDVFQPSTKITTGERYLGNTPSFNLTTAATNLDHFDADEGIKTKDDSVTLELNRTGAFVTDNIDPDNVALFFLGEASIAVEAGQIGRTSTILLPLGDRYYQLGVTVGNPSGDRQVSAVTAPTAVLDTDFTYDAELGRVYIVEGGTLDGDASVVFTYTVAARSRKRIITSSSATVDGALKFLAYNPKGVQLDYLMPSVKISPNGDYELKGETWQQISFNVEINERDDNTEAIYVDGRPYTP